MTKVDSAKHWIDRNIWMILAGGLGVYGGYLTGQATTTAKIDELNRDVVELRAVVDEMHPRQN